MYNMEIVKLTGIVEILRKQVIMLGWANFSVKFWSLKWTLDVRLKIRKYSPNKKIASDAQHITEMKCNTVSLSYWVKMGFGWKFWRLRASPQVIQTTNKTKKKPELGRGISTKPKRLEFFLCWTPSQNYIWKPCLLAHIHDPSYCWLYRWNPNSCKVKVQLLCQSAGLTILCSSRTG